MFTKKPDLPGGEMPKPLAPMPIQSAPMSSMQRSSPMATAASTNSSNSVASVIGTDLNVIGNLQSKGEIQIEGQVQGDLLASRIVIGPNAKITGGLVADDIVVHGTVQGSIRGLRVTLQSNSRVEGDVFHQSLAIEQGAYFEGKSRRSENPKESQKTSGVTPIS
jgi:cytoskeletal protein CcmA (bactofilin family)